MMKPGDVFRDTRWGPEIQVIGVVTLVDGDYIEAVVIKVNRRNKLMGLDSGYSARVSDVVLMRDVVEVPSPSIEATYREALDEAYANAEPPAELLTETVERVERELKEQEEQSGEEWR